MVKLVMGGLMIRSIRLREYAPHDRERWKKYLMNGGPSFQKVHRDYGSTNAVKQAEFIGDLKKKDRATRRA
jgi:hypothetical protein